MGNMTVSARHQVAQPRLGRRRRGCMMGERALTSCTAEAGAAAKRVLDDGERAPPGGTAEAGAAATGLLDDGERSAMTRELVAKRRSKSNRVTGTIGSRVTGYQWASEVGTGRWRAGTAAGEDIVAGVTIRPPLSCVKQSATSGTKPAPGDGDGAA